MTRFRPRRVPLLAWLACAVLLGSHLAEAQHVISIATLAPAGSTWMRVLEASSRELRRRTGGQLTIRWYAGGVQGDEAEVIRKIRVGRIDGAAVTGAGLGQIHRPTLAFELPAMFESVAQFVHARDALRPEIETAFDRAGFELLGFDAGGVLRMFSTRPIRTPSDFRRARPWLWPDHPVGPLVYAEIGVTGVPLQLPDVVGALQTGRVDTVFGSPLSVIALQWAPYVRYMTAQGASAMLSGLVVSRTQFQSLTTEQQRVVREVVAEYHTLLARNLIRDEQAAEQALRSRGMQVITPTAAETSQWLSVFAGVRRRAAGEIADSAWLSRIQSARGP